jgi:hypothetical protein
MTDNRQRSPVEVLDSETFERLPPEQTQTPVRPRVVDSETSEPLSSPVPACSLAKRLRLMIQRAFEAELDYYSRVFGRDEG